MKQSGSVTHVCFFTKRATDATESDIYLSGEKHQVVSDFKWVGVSKPLTGTVCLNCFHFVFEIIMTSSLRGAVNCWQIHVVYLMYRQAMQTAEVTCSWHLLLQHKDTVCHVPRAVNLGFASIFDGQLSSRRRGQYRCIKAGTERLKNSFSLKAIRLLNSHH